MTKHLSRRAVGVLAAAVMASVASEVHAQLSGQLGAHDPSSLVKEGSQYYYFATGQGIVSRTSANMTAWSAGPSVFSTPPAWTTQAVSGFTGNFWAPDIAYFGGSYHLYYSASSWGTIDSAIGVATSPTLANATWTDQGKVVQSDAIGQTDANTDTTGYNAIDPSILTDTTGKVWMSFGSYSSGILVTEINPATGKRVNTSSLTATQVASNAPNRGWGSSIEGSALIKRGSYYYLFVNYGGCCSGVSSTYDMRVGRSASPTGPFLDKDGVDMRDGGGTVFLDDDGKMIGPGHFGYYTEAGQDYFSYHYYNGDSNGAPTYGVRKLYWTTDAWPSYATTNPNWAGTLDANWSNASNWGTGGVPNAIGSNANFVANSANRYSVTLDGSGKTVSTVNFRGTASYTIGTNAGNTLTLDAATGDSSTINVQAGNHTIAAPMVSVDNLGINIAPSTSTLTISGSVSAPTFTKYGFGTVALAGANTFTGQVLARWGTLDITGTVTTSGYTSIAPIAGESAKMILRSTASYTSTGDFNIGDTGDSATAATGTLELKDTASLVVNSTGGFFVGSGFSGNTRAVGTVNQSGGTLTANGNFDGSFIIGGRGSSLAVGTYNLSGGTVNANPNVRVGGYGTGTVNQTAGTFNAAGYVSIGRYAGATGAWNISGGTLNHTNASAMIIVGEAGTGSLSVSGTGQVTTGASLRLGHSNGGAGTVNLNTGGKITARTVSRGTGSGTATFNFNGGTLAAQSAQTGFMTGLTRANIRNGGAIISTNGFDITINQPLLHSEISGDSTTDGGLTKLGAGTLTLSGVSSYTGSTTITTGTLTLTTAGSLAGSGNISVNSGATLNALGLLKSGANLNVSGTATVGANLGTLTPTGQRLRTLGTLSVASGGALSLSAASTHAGRTLLELSSLTNTGKIDIADNDLLIHNANATSLANLVNQIKAGRNRTPGGGFDGNWNGTSGLVSSAVSASLASNGIEDRSIGYMLVSDYFFGSINSFDGAAVTGSDLIVKYTRNGDADLSGVVDDNDVSLVGAFYNDSLTTHHWYDGDYDGNGRIDDNDVAVLGTFYDLSRPALSAAGLTNEYGPAFAAAFEGGLANNTGSAVPEPASLGMLVIGATLLARRSRRV